jgi:hypothetical protein
VLVLYSGGKEVPTPWKHVSVGNLVKIRVNEEVPADLVLLSTSDEGGLCYVETANLVSVLPSAGYVETANLVSVLPSAGYVETANLVSVLPSAGYVETANLVSAFRRSVQLQEYSVEATLILPVAQLHTFILII